MKKETFFELFPWLLLACLMICLFVHILEGTISSLWVKVLLNFISGIGVAATFSVILAKRLSKPVRELLDWAKSGLDMDTKGYKPGQAIQALQNNIADLKKRLIHAEDERSRLGLLFANMKELVVLLDHQKRIVTINRASEEFLGLKGSNVSGKPFGAVFRDMNLKAFVDQAFSDFSEKETEIAIYGGKEGIEKRYFFIRSVVVRPIKGTGGPSMLIVMDDRTNIKRLENLRKEFVANVSHELKTPITAIKGYVETLLDDELFKKDQETTRQFLQVVKKQGERLNRLVEEILLLSRIEERHRLQETGFEKSNVREIITSAIDSCKILALEKDMEIKLEAPKKLPSIRVDPGLLEQAITNLFTNAINYSPPKGKVKLSATIENGQLILAVKDNGIGIPKEHQDRIFERFYRVDKARSRKLGGTGLGLAIVKHIVKMHKGRISLESSPGKGSNFKIMIPIS